MGSKRNSLSETGTRTGSVHQPTKTEQCHGIGRTPVEHNCHSSGTEFRSAVADLVQFAGDAEVSDWNEKAHEWLGTGELEVVRPETHPEAFVPVAPDGGWSWIVLLASFFSSVIIDGITFSVGLLLADLAEYFKPSKAKVALVGSLFVGCYQIIGPMVAAMINRFGCRAVAIIGGLLACAAMFVSSFATNMDSLLCTFGVIGGTSFGLIHLPAMISVNVYFNRRRALANGIAVVGTPVGAVIFGHLTSYLLQVYHWSNTLIIFAGLLLHCVLFACLYRPLLPAVTLHSVHTSSVPEGLDELIAEELHSGYFNSNGYIRSIVTFASNNRIVQPLVEVDEPIDTEPLLRNQQVSLPNGTANGTVGHETNTANAAPIQETVTQDEPEAGRDFLRRELKQTDAQNLDQRSLCRSDSSKSALSAPSILSAGSSDDEELDNKENLVQKQQLLEAKQGQMSVTDVSKENKNAELQPTSESDNQAITQPKDTLPSLEQTVTLTKTKQSGNVPAIQTPNNPEAHRTPVTRSAQVSCILSTPCLSGFQTYQDRFCHASGTLIESGRNYHGNRHRHLNNHKGPGHHHHRHHYYQQQNQLYRNNPVGVNHQSSSSRLWKNLSGIPTIEEGHVLESIPTNAANPTNAEVNSGAIGSARDYSSSITVAGLTREFIRRHRLPNTPSVNSGALHLSAFSGLTNSAIKIKLARMDSKPAVVMLPHPVVSIRDYRRPMYRSDIFYSGNVAPELGTTARSSIIRPRSQAAESQSRLSDLIGSAFSLRPDSLSRRVSGSRRESNTRVSNFVDPEAGMAFSQPNWYESYLVSLTRIPVGLVDFEDNSVHQITPWWCSTACLSRVFCGVQTDHSDDEDSLQQMSFCDCCLTCIRRLRDCRLPLTITRSKIDHKIFKASRRESSTYSNKFDAAGDAMSDTASHIVKRGSTCSPGMLLSKAFTDVLNNMTDFKLIRNRGYRLAFFANFFGVLGSYVPIIYVTEFATQNGIPESMCSYLISVMGLLSILGRLSFAWLSALCNIRPIVVQTVTQLFSGVLIALMPLFVNFATQATAFGLMGFLSGPFASLSTIILCDLVGVDSLTTAVGLVTLSRGLSSVLGAPLAGVLHGWTGNFTIPYVTSGMTIVISSVLFGAIICQPKKTPEKTDQNGMCND